MARVAIPQGQNYLIESENFNNASRWNKDTCTLSSATAPPSGPSTAWSIVDTAANNSHGVYRDSGADALGLSTQDVWTHSVYAKRQRLNFMFLWMNNFAILQFFNLSTGAVASAAGAVIAASIEDVGSGWYRCSASCRITIAGAGFEVAASSADLTSSYVGNATAAIDIAGAQVVRANWAGKYQVTSGSAVTSGIRSVP